MWVWQTSNPITHMMPHPPLGSTLPDTFSRSSSAEFSQISSPLYFLTAPFSFFPCQEFVWWIGWVTHPPSFLISSSRVFIFCLGIACPASQPVLRLGGGGVSAWTTPPLLPRCVKPRDEKRGGMGWRECGICTMKLKVADSDHRRVHTNGERGQD